MSGTSNESFLSKISSKFPGTPVEGIVLFIIVVLLLFIFESMGITPRFQDRPSSEAGEYNREKIPANDYDFYPLDVKESDVFLLDFRVVSGDGPVDVYIMKEEVRRGEYELRDYFEPIFMEQETSEIHENLAIPEDGDYVLVVDNFDNGRIDDAEPVGEIVYNIDYEVEDGDLIGKILTHPSFPLIFAILLLSVAIVAMVRFKSRRGIDEEHTNQQGFHEFEIQQYRHHDGITVPDQLSKEVKCDYCNCIFVRDMNGACRVCGHGGTVKQVHKEDIMTWLSGISVSDGGNYIQDGEKNKGLSAKDTHNPKSVKDDPSEETHMNGDEGDPVPGLEESDSPDLSMNNKCSQCGCFCSKNEDGICQACGYSDRMLSSGVHSNC